MMMLVASGICSLLAVVTVWRGVIAVKVLQDRAIAIPKRNSREPFGGFYKYVALVIEPKENDAEVFKYRKRAMWAFSLATLLVVASQHLLWTYFRANNG